MKKLTLAALLAVASLGVAHADPISGLYNTGAGFAAGQADTHYTMTVQTPSSGVANGNGYVAGNYSWPVDGTWFLNDASSSWITPTRTAAQSLDPSQNGTYTFTLNFSLAGFDASTASLAGKFAADNSATVLLNGNAISTGGTGFNSWTGTFAANSGFVAGNNTLDFVLTNFAQNGGNPAGLRVQFGASNVVAVPEPETYGMLLAGLGLVGLVARRRRAS